MITQLGVLVSMLLAAIPRLCAAMFGGHNRLTRLTLGGGLLMFSVGQLLSLPPITSCIDIITTAGVGKVAYNVTTMLGQFLLICFLGRAAGSRPMGRFLLRHGGIFAAATAALVGLMVATPHTLRHHSLQSPFMDVPSVALFYVVGNAYFTYAYVEIGWRTWRYPTQMTRPITPLMRLSLRLTAIASAGLAVTSLARATWVVRKSVGASAPEWFNWTNWQLSNVAFVLLAAGLSLLVAADIVGAVQVLRRRAQHYRDMTTLWVEMQRAFPEITLEWWWPAGRFRRRIIECLDGLTRLSPYLGIAAEGADIRRSRLPELAGHVWKALRLKPDLDAHGGELAAVNLPFGADSDSPGDVAAQLADLSLALRAHQAEQAVV